MICNDRKGDVAKGQTELLERVATEKCSVRILTRLVIDKDLAIIMRQVNARLRKVVQLDVASRGGVCT